MHVCVVTYKEWDPHDSQDKLRRSDHTSVDLNLESRSATYAV